MEVGGGGGSWGVVGGGVGEVVGCVSVADRIYPPTLCSPFFPVPGSSYILGASIRKDRTTDGVSSRSQAFGGVFGLTLLKLFPKTNGMLLNFLELQGNGPGGG